MVVVIFRKKSPSYYNQLIPNQDRERFIKEKKSKKYFLFNLAMSINNSSCYSCARRNSFDIPSPTLQSSTPISSIVLPPTLELLAERKYLLTKTLVNNEPTIVLVKSLIFKSGVVKTLPSTTNTANITTTNTTATTTATVTNPQPSLLQFKADFYSRCELGKCKPVNVSLLRSIKVNGKAIMRPPVQINLKDYDVLVLGHVASLKSSEVTNYLVVLCFLHDEVMNVSSTCFLGTVRKNQFIGGRSCTTESGYVPTHFVSIPCGSKQFQCELLGCGYFVRDITSPDYVNSKTTCLCFQMKTQTNEEYFLDSALLEPTANTSSAQPSSSEVAQLDLRPLHESLVKSAKIEKEIAEKIVTEHISERLVPSTIKRIQNISWSNSHSSNELCDLTPSSFKKRKMIHKEIQSMDVPTRDVLQLTSLAKEKPLSPLFVTNTSSSTPSSSSSPSLFSSSHTLYHSNSSSHLSDCTLTSSSSSSSSSSHSLP